MCVQYLVHVLACTCRSLTSQLMLHVAGTLITQVWISRDVYVAAKARPCILVTHQSEAGLGAQHG